MNAITAQYANDLRDTPIKVNAVCPGYRDTDMNGHTGPVPRSGGRPWRCGLRPCRRTARPGAFFNEDGPLPW